MNTIKVNDTAYKGAGWAVAVIVNGEVVDAEYIEHPDTGDVVAAVAALESRSIYTTANAKADAAWAKLESADPDSDEYEQLDRDFNEAAVLIRGGMMSGTEFCLNFTKRDRAKIGIRNEWF